MATFFRSPVSYLYMTVLWRFTFSFFVFSILVACNTARRIPMEALGGITAGATTRFVFPTSGSNAEAYLTGLRGRPIQLMILLQAHVWIHRWRKRCSRGGTLCPRSGRFTSRLRRDRSAAGVRSKVYLERYLERSPGRGFFSQEAPLDRCKAIVPLWLLPWRILRRAAGQPDRRNQRGSLAVRSL
jgi:hypothetical protein